MERLPDDISLAMKSSFLLPVAALATAALAATTGCMSTAQQNEKKPAGGATSTFQMLDKDKDGRVTYAEFDAGFADAMFALYNYDGTGAITKTDWNDIERAHQDEAAATYRALDLNHDGKLTKEELNTHGKRRDATVRRLFDAIDKNHKGFFTLTEAQSFGVKRAAAQDPANHP